MRKTIQARISELRGATGGSASCGWMGDEVCWLLLGLVRFYQPSLVVQTGHLWGKSALVVCEALRRQTLDRDQGMGDPAYADFVAANSPPHTKGKLISIDPNPLGVPNPEAGVKLLRSWYPGFVHISTPSQEFFSHFEVAPEERLLGIVDGDHSQEGARADVRALVRLGARAIVLDDTSWLPELRRVVSDGMGYSVTTFEEYNGVTLLVKR